MAKTIFITGASKGFGKVWAEAFLKRGDNVIASSRDISPLDGLAAQYGDRLVTMKLDVTDRAAVFAGVQKAAAQFGRIDVLINNAGYGLFGAIEETTEAEARAQFETNVFGLLWVTQAVIPVMRAQQSGHIIQVSSVLGLATFPTLGVYNSSKFAVEGLTESLAPEVAQFGIKVTMLEPNAFSTDWIGASAIRTEANPLYDKVKSDLYESFPADFFGDPTATAEIVLKVVDSANPPLRAFVGKIGYPFIKQKYAERWTEWDSWKTASDNAHGY